MHPYRLPVLATLALICWVPAVPFSTFAAKTAKEIDWSILSADDTLVLYFKDTRVGALYNKQVVDNVKRVITAHLRVEISAGSEAAAGFSSMDLEETRIYDFNGNMVSASQRLKSATGDALWKIVNEKPGKWLYTVSVAGEEKKEYLPHAGGNLHSSYSMQRSILDRSVKPGDEWCDTLFELTAASNYQARMRCVAIPDTHNPNYVFINRDNLVNREERYEIDTCGRLMIKEDQQIFIAKRYAAQDKQFNKQENTGNLSALFVIPKERGRKSSETIAVTLQAGATMHESVRRFYLYANGRYMQKPFPRKCSAGKPRETGKNMDEWQGSTVTIQSKNPAIIQLADSLKQGLSDRCEIIARFNDYLYRTLEKKYTATFSNASETLKSGAGDCGEHAVLLAALLRAAGIESNVVLGLVYSDQNKGYYYHAWVAVHADQLLFSDPALGPFPATDGYIPLVMDNDGTNLVHLAGLIGRIAISYVPKKSGQ